MDKTLNINPLKTDQKTISNKPKSNSFNYENGSEKSVSAFIPKPKMEDLDTEDLIIKMKQIAVTAFNNAAKKSIGSGYPINLDLNGLIIRLNPDKTYEIIETKKKLLNTITTINL